MWRSGIAAETEYGRQPEIVLAADGRFGPWLGISGGFRRLRGREIGRQFGRDQIGEAVLIERRESLLGGIAGRFFLFHIRRRLGCWCRGGIGLVGGQAEIE